MTVIDVEAIPDMEVTELADLDASPICQWDHGFRVTLEADDGHKLGEDCNGEAPCAVIAEWIGSSCFTRVLLCDPGKQEIEARSLSEKLYCPQCGTDCTGFIPL